IVHPHRSPGFRVRADARPGMTPELLHRPLNDIGDGHWLSDKLAACLYNKGSTSRPAGKGPMKAKDNLRTAAEVLVDQLIVNGVRHAFCVPGESYLAVLDAFHDRDIAVTVCRHESGAAMMAEAVGKVTGRPGICFVTRGPGATNASAGIHIAQQDSSPMIVF